jgi:hypothetical protein
MASAAGGKNVSYTIDSDGIATVVFDLQGSKVNTLNMSLAQEFEDTMSALVGIKPGKLHRPAPPPALLFRDERRCHDSNPSIVLFPHLPGKRPQSARRCHHLGQEGQLYRRRRH